MVSAFSEDVFELDPTNVRDALLPISEVDANLEEEADEDDQHLQRELVREFSKICRCFAHTLQLPLRNVFDENDDVMDMLKSVMRILNRFNKSHVATRALLERTGLKLLFPAVTRWSSHAIVLGRLLKVLPAVNEICLERKWQPLSENAEVRNTFYETGEVPFN